MNALHPISIGENHIATCSTHIPVIIATKRYLSRPVANATRAYGIVLLTCLNWLAGAGINFKGTHSYSEIANNCNANKREYERKGLRQEAMRMSVDWNI